MSTKNSQLHKCLSLTGVVVSDVKIDNVNAASIREAMGLPKTLPSSSMGNLNFYFDSMCSVSISDLILVAESKTHKFQQRFVAGQLLGLRGDPRINVYEPNMIELPGGKHCIGLDSNSVESVLAEYAAYGVKKSWILKETPEHSTFIEPFALAKYCVTNKEYLTFMLDSQYTNIPEGWEINGYPLGKSNHPVCSISAEDADCYTEWLSSKTGRNFRLPSEYEWEYAASGPNRTEFPWGNKFLSDHANTLESGILATTPVGIFGLGAGFFGHLDLAGNVEEYVADDYLAYPGGYRVVDDLAPNGTKYRVARGGSYTRYRDLSRTRRRHGRYYSSLYQMGFRLAESLN